ncbi:ClpP/crotonase-like domain-containing protein [Sporodiniella umbellata]|nr:ClpP/crotonase-like domain-containing protein [Sporodiniella umbellata]
MATFPLELPSKDDHQMTLSREGPLFILRLHNNENRFTRVFIRSIIHALEVIEDLNYALEEEEDMALVTVGEGKFFSNGLELKSVLLDPSFIDSYHLMLKKMLTFCIPTVAVINGHAFAGGCMFALAHDYRIMREDRGYICMNEVDLPSSLSSGMSSIIRQKTTPTIYRDMILQARRFGAKDALQCGLVDAVSSEKELFSHGKELALKWAHKAKAGIAYKQLKESMYEETVKNFGVPFNRLASKL